MQRLLHKRFHSTTKTIFIVDSAIQDAKTLIPSHCKGLWKSFGVLPVEVWALGRRGLTSLTMCTIAMWMLACGIVNCVNEDLKICEHNAIVLEKILLLGSLQYPGNSIKKINSSWCWLSITSGRSPWFSLYIGKHWLYALRVEDLSN